MVEAQANPKIDLKSVDIVGFASPEGEEDKNNTLSTDRSGSAKESCMKVANKAENEKAAGEIYNTSGSGEDYPGFKTALQADTEMNEDDKNLVLRVLDMYKNSEEREKAMRDLGKTFTYVPFLHFWRVFTLMRSKSRSNVMTGSPEMPNWGTPT